MFGNNIQSSLGKLENIDIITTKEIVVAITVQDIKHLYEKKLYHGTDSSQISSVLDGPKNIGSGLGGEALYVFLNDETNAIHMAEIKTQFGGSPTIMKGSFNPSNQLVVGRIHVVRPGQPVDFLKGIWPADWQKNQELKTLVQNTFDVLEICGAKSADIAIDSDHFAVVYERAGKKAINWQGAYSPKHTPINPELFFKAHVNNEHTFIPDKKLTPKHNLHVKPEIVKIQVGNDVLYQVQGLSIYAKCIEHCQRLYEHLQKLETHSAIGKIIHESLIKDLHPDNKGLIILGYDPSMIPTGFRGALYPTWFAFNTSLYKRLLVVASLDDMRVSSHVTFGHETTHYFLETLCGNHTCNPFTKLSDSIGKKFINTFLIEELRLKQNPFPMGTLQWKVHNRMYREIFEIPRIYQARNQFNEVLARCLQYEVAFEITRDGGLLRQFSPAIANSFQQALIEIKKIPYGDFSAPQSSFEKGMFVEPYFNLMSYDEKRIYANLCYANAKIERAEYLEKNHDLKKIEQNGLYKLNDSNFSIKDFDELNSRKYLPAINLVGKNTTPPARKLDFLHDEKIQTITFEELNNRTGNARTSGSKIRPPNGITTIEGEVIRVKNLNDSFFKGFLKEMGKQAYATLREGEDFVKGTLKVLNHPAISIPTHVIFAYKKGEEDALFNAFVDGTATWSVSAVLYRSLLSIPVIGQEVALVVGLGTLSAELAPNLNELEKSIPTNEEFYRQQNIDPKNMSPVDIETAKIVVETRGALQLGSMLQQAFKALNPFRITQKVFEDDNKSKVGASDTASTNSSEPIVDPSEEFIASLKDLHSRIKELTESNLLNPQSKENISQSIEEKPENTSIDTQQEVFIPEELIQPKPPKEKPRAFDWENRTWGFGATLNGYFEGSLTVPVRLGNYTSNAKISVQTDPKMALDTFKALFNIKIDKISKHLKTEFGTYKIEWYKQGNTFWKTNDEAKYKGEIKDPDGNKHTFWVTGSGNISSELDRKLKKYTARSLEKEISQFCYQFNQLLEKFNISDAQKSLDIFTNRFKNTLSGDFKKPFLLAINESKALQNVENFKHKSISEMIARLDEISPTTEKNPLMGLALFIEQDGLKNILCNKLKETGSLQDREEIKHLNKKISIQHIEPPTIATVTFPDKTAFQGIKTHGRQEYYDRGKTAYHKILGAYTSYQQALRAGEGVEEAQRTFQQKYKEVEAGGHSREWGYEGFDIQMKNGKSFGEWFKKQHPEIVNAAQGDAPWQKEYQKAISEPLQLFSSEELREIDIHLGFRDFNSATAILVNKDAPFGDKQKAFDQKYTAANILKDNLKADEIGDVHFFQVLDHQIQSYQFYEKSLRLAEAGAVINEIAKDYVTTKEGKTSIHFNRMTDSELLKLREHAQIIAKEANPEGKCYQFAFQNLRHNYEVHSDSYGKFAGLVMSTIASSFTRQPGKESEETWVNSACTTFMVTNTLFPSVLPDLIVLPQSIYEGNFLAAWTNLNEGIVRSCQQPGAVSALTCISLVGPLFYQNRSFYQYLSLGTNILSTLSTIKYGATPLLLKSLSLPFDTYEFVSSDLELPMRKSDWTIVDRIKKTVHEKVQQSKGNLPENSAYYGIKNSISFMGTVSNILLLDRLARGGHGSHRDIKYATIAVITLVAIQALMGSYRNQSIQAMQKNALSHFNEGQYESALASYERLIDTLEAKNSKDFKNWLDAVEKSLICERNIIKIKRDQSYIDRLRLKLSEINQKLEMLWKQELHLQQNFEIFGIFCQVFEIEEFISIDINPKLN